MKKYLLPLILILLLTFTLIGNCWVVGYDQRIKLSIDISKIDVELTWFPITVFLKSTQAEEIFSELDADADYMKIAFTKADGETQLYGEKQLFDISEQKAIYHVSREGWGISYLAQFKITGDSTARTDYGLSYPITYKFNIPAAATGLTAWIKYQSGGTWSQVTAKTTDDFFNGIDAIRFDYTNDFAYLSVAFNANYNDIYVQFRDSGGDLTSGISYDSITDYYDNRKAVVTFTADDWEDAHDTIFEIACDACYNRNIWLTVGIITDYEGSPPTWSKIQAKITQGYVEPACHSATHPDVPYGDYDAEIGGSAADIKSNLILPSLNKKGNTEYIYAWIEPYGHSDATVRTKLLTYKYLIARDDVADDTYATWNATDGLFNRVGFSIQMGSDGTEVEATLNGDFDTVYAAEGIYHLMCHPYNVNWNAGQYALNHLDHIKDKKDVWYVGFGHLYAYYYAKNQSKVTAISDSPNVDFYMYYDNDADDNTTYIGAINTAAGRLVYDGSTEGVWHLCQDPNGDGADAIKDSTSNIRHLTPSGTMTTADLVDAKVGKGIDFEGTDDKLSRASGDTGITNAYTISSIIKLDTDAHRAIFNLIPTTGRANEVRLYYYAITDKINSANRKSDDSGYIKDYSSNDTISLATWYLISTTWDGTDLHIYINDSQSIPYTKTADNTGVMTNTNRLIHLGHDSAGSLFWDGIIDETYLASVARSAAWMKATYNSLWDTLLTYWSEETEPNVVFFGTNF